MLLIYSPYNSSRLQYTLHVIFKSVLNINFQITTSIDAYHQSTLPKLIYSTNSQTAHVTIHLSNLLFEQDIKPIDITPFKNQNFEFPLFFKTEQTQFLNFDIFSLTFYFASRYEEYLLSDKDKHDRFKAENSTAYKNNILQIPYLHYVIWHFADELKKQFPTLTFKKPKAIMLSTVDVDNAFAYVGKGVFRNLASILKKIGSGNWIDLTTQIKSLINHKHDPYNTYSIIEQLNLNYPVKSLYFFLIGNYSKYDKNPYYKNESFIQLIKSIVSKHKIGLHPSYKSFLNYKSLTKENNRLQQITNQQITNVRAHFIKVEFPKTYQNYITEGLTDDYSMIFTSQCGFRTGLCVPYPWFDVLHNKQTNLIIHTSVVMEGILRDYNKRSAAEAIIEIEQLINETKKMGGQFISVWHNDCFTKKNWPYAEVYQKMLHLFYSTQ